MRREFMTSALLALAVLAGCGDGSGPDYGGGSGALTTLTLTPAAPVLFATAPGRSIALGLVARDDRGLTLSGGSAQFTSDDPEVATVDGTGLVTAAGVGEARITAVLTLDGVTRSTASVVTVRLAPEAAAVSAPNLAFDPGTVDVATGGTVTWTTGAILHTVTFETAGAPASIEAFQNGAIGRTFTESGTYPYHCAIHQGMTGVVRVHDDVAGLSDSAPEGLWTASAVPGGVLRLTRDELQGEGERAPATEILIPGGGVPALAGMAFATDGTLWVANPEDETLLAFVPAALARSGLRVASRVIAPADGSLSAPIGLAFDRLHRLWVANSGNGTVVRFDAGALASGGAAGPSVVDTVFGRPAMLAFAGDGSLWVGDTQLQTIQAFHAEDLAVSGRPYPFLGLRRGPNVLNVPTSMAFDDAGTLWVGNSGNHTLTAFTASQVTAGGPSTASIVVGPTDGSLAIPEGLAFDAEGNLWVTNLTGTVERFRRSDLAVSGAPTPSVRLRLTGHPLLWGTAFWPTPAGLPIN